MLFAWTLICPWGYTSRDLESNAWTLAKLCSSDLNCQSNSVRHGQETAATVAQRGISYCTQLNHKFAMFCLCNHKNVSHYYSSDFWLRLHLSPQYYSSHLQLYKDNNLNQTTSWWFWSTSERHRSVLPFLSFVVSGKRIEIREKSEAALL